MITYQLTNDPKIVKRSDGVLIPEDDKNMDYQDYKLWLVRGGIPAAAPTPPADRSDNKVALNLLLRNITNVSLTADDIITRDDLLLKLGG